jgi:hypothetical protein
MSHTTSAGAVYHGRMACQEFEKLEQQFVDIRRSRLQHLTSGTMTLDMEDKLSRAELQALYAVLDHRNQHDCQPTATRAPKLPASRNIGGIIGPY